MKEQQELLVVILAAGEGTRMKSSLPKVLHQLCGRPLLEFVIDAAQSLEPREIIGVVSGPGPVEDLLRQRGCGIAYQKVRRGTGDAANLGIAEASADCKRVLILNGDVPLLETATLNAMVRDFQGQFGILGAELENPTGYGRIVEKPEQLRIIEQVDASEEERKIRLINAGVYVGSLDFYRHWLPLLQSNNEQGELYLTDLAEKAHPGQWLVQKAQSAQEVQGVNNRAQLAQVEAVLRNRKNHALMLAGVTFKDPSRTYIDWASQVEEDCTLYPGVVLEGESRVGQGSILRSNVRLTNSTVGEHCQILDGSVLENASVGFKTRVGPMAHLRPGTELGPECRIGNFVETKKAVFGKGSKASHLSYIGDAAVGSEVNIGCGTITCNYDGVDKHQTVLEDQVFVGSDTQFIAPVRVGRGAIIASGTTVTGDVPEQALLLSRAAPIMKENYAPRYWEKRRGKSDRPTTP